MEEGGLLEFFFPFFPPQAAAAAAPEVVKITGIRRKRKRGGELFRRHATKIWENTGCATKKPFYFSNATILLIPTLFSLKKIKIVFQRAIFSLLFSEQPELIRVSYVSGENKLEGGNISCISFFLEEGGNRKGRQMRGKEKYCTL